MATTMRVCARGGRNAGMADDPVWPDPFRPRIVAPAKGKKKREEIESRTVNWQRTNRDITPITCERYLILPLSQPAQS